MIRVHQDDSLNVFLNLFGTTRYQGFRCPFKKTHPVQNIFEEFFHLGMAQAPIFEVGVQIA